MKEHVARKWCDALRSGEYNQTKELLCSSEGYCCLGVLTDLYIKEMIEEAPLFAPNWEEAYKNNDKELTVYMFNHESETLPPEVMEWAGMKDKCGTYDSVQKCLTVLNDEGFGFNYIASVIDENYEDM